MYNSNRVSERITSLVKERGIPVKKVSEASNLNYNMMTHTKTSIQADNLAKLTDYLDCSVDYLLGPRTQTSINNPVPKLDTGGVLDNFT